MLRDRLARQLRGQPAIPSYADALSVAHLPNKALFQELGAILNGLPCGRCSPGEDRVLKASLRVVLGF